MQGRESFNTLVWILVVKVSRLISDSFPAAGSKLNNCRNLVIEVVLNKRLSPLKGVYPTVERLPHVLYI